MTICMPQVVTLKVPVLVEILHLRSSFLSKARYLESRQLANLYQLERYLSLSFIGLFGLGINPMAGDKGVEPLQTRSQSPARYHYTNPQYKQDTI